MQKNVFNDMTKRLVLTVFLYIFPMWGQLFQPISFSDIWRGSDKLYTAFHGSKGIVFPFTPAANNSRTYVNTITQEAVSLLVFHKVQIQEEHQVC